MSTLKQVFGSNISCKKGVYQSAVLIIIYICKTGLIRLLPLYISYNTMHTTNHYTLTKKQLVILNLLYRFRFATSEQLSQILNITQATINKRLKLMMEQEYIGRHYEPEYRLLRQHASYYLLPKGAKELKRANTKYSPTVLKNTNNDKDASDGFINHCLDVFNVYCTLRSKYGDRLRFFTKTQLTTFEHYPQPLPDAYIQLDNGDEERQFFLDVLHESQPFFVATRKVMQYVAYAEDNSEEWEQATGTALPSVLLICDSVSLKKRLQKKMRRAAEGIEDTDTKLYAAVMSEIGDNSGWHDLADVEQAFSLDDIQ